MESAKKNSQKNWVSRFFQEKLAGKWVSRFSPGPSSRPPPTAGVVSEVETKDMIPELRRKDILAFQAEVLGCGEHMAVNDCETIPRLPRGQWPHPGAPQVRVAVVILLRSIYSLVL